MEKFKKVPDDLKWGSMNRYEITLAAGQFEVYVRQVMYGYRVVGGFVDYGCCEFNWCCGNEKTVILTSQHVLMTLIENGTPFKSIPTMSTIKPWYNDDEFVKRVYDLLGQAVMRTLANALNNEKMGT